MAFIINKITSKTPTENIVDALKLKLAQSRFVVGRIVNTTKRVMIHDVRLKKKKDYCGNHPLPCPVRPYSKPHKHFTFLEGADWVGFNDMINDVLDELGAVYDVASSHVKIRVKGARCVRYDAQLTPNGIDAEWKKDSKQYVNHIGMGSMKAEYPEGTPGFAEWQGEWDYPSSARHLHTH